MNKIVIGAIAILIVILGGIYLTQKQESRQPAQKSSQSSETPPSPAIGPGPTEGNLGGQAPAPSPGPSESPPPTNPQPDPSPEPPAPTPTPPPNNPTPPAPQVKTFNVTGHNFAFSISEIRVKKNDIVKINFQSTEGFHDWTLEGYSVGTQPVNAPGSASVEFVADKTGSFVFYCSVGTHRQMGMVGTLIVE
jgi:plastocyanin